MKKRQVFAVLASAVATVVLAVLLLPTRALAANLEDYGIIGTTYNTEAVRNRPTETSRWRIKSDSSYQVKSIMTYHWNNGNGATPGTIRVFKDDQLIGSWKAQGLDNNRNWVVYVDIRLEPGHVYIIDDSDWPTWSQNDKSRNEGFVELRGYKIKLVGTPMHRLYNPNSGEHFYTASTAEKNAVVKAGWRYEGIGWYAPTKSNTPVYRLYNPNAGDHHYTTNKAERDMLVGVGWRDEGIGWYSDDNKQIPLYRQYNPNARAGAHNFTTSLAENDHLVRVGWRAEGIAWYGVNPNGGAVG